MKKLLLLSLICGAAFSADAQVVTDTVTTTTSRKVTRASVKHRYYYYPGSNVYFDETSGNYWYRSAPDTTWTMAQTLPTTITIDRGSRYLMPYNNDEPWRHNAADIKKYKIKKDGSVKVKPRKS
jgi:hypothetical protein